MTYNTSAMAASYTRSYYNDLYLTELSEDQVLIPPECSPNWKVQEKT